MKCQYYTKHLETIFGYIKCLYEIEGCGAGGLLHILLDDDNLDDSSISYCLAECIKHPEREESKLGALICEEYLKLNEHERKLLSERGNGGFFECIVKPGIYCNKDCWICKEGFDTG